MKKLISVGIVFLIILTSFSSCGTNPETEYAKIAVDKVKSVLSKSENMLSIERIRVEINDPPQDFIPFPNDENNEQNYKNIKARVMIDYSYGDISSYCCVLINDEVVFPWFYLTDDQYLQTIADKIAESDTPEFFKSFMLEREHKRNETYLPSSDEMSTWSDIDVSKVS